MVLSSRRKIFVCSMPRSGARKVVGESVGFDDRVIIFVAV